LADDINSPSQVSALGAHCRPLWVQGG